MDFKTVETIDLECRNTGSRVKIYRKQWTARTSGSTHEAWFRRGKIVSVSFTNHEDVVWVTGGDNRKATKHYVRVW